jgi:hypothetical protein
LLPIRWDHWTIQGAPAEDCRLLQSILITDRGTLRWQIARLEAADPGGCAEQQAGAAVGQDMRHLSMLEKRIDRHMDQPCPRCRQRHQASKLVFGRPTGHPSAVCVDLLAQPCS